MGMYRCDHCDELADNDYNPCEESADGFGLLCPSCADNTRCPECGEVAEWEEETFEYSGTHCNHGRGGTHHTGIFVSKCCGVSE